MSLTQDQAQSPSQGINVCNLTVDDHLKQIQSNLPQGAAWPRDPDATQTRYWRAYAEVIKFLEDRICNLNSEFFCQTANETLDVWTEQYGIESLGPIDYDDPCLKPEFLEEPLLNLGQSAYVQDLCGRVAAQGGSTCEYFESVARSVGYEVNCIDCDAEFDYAIAGCMEAGCAQLGPPGELIEDGGNESYNTLTNCEYERAVDHPQSRFWGNLSNQGQAQCDVPGSDLGCEDSPCCTHAGYYDIDGAPETVLSNSCGDLDTPILFDQCASDEPFKGPQCTSVDGSFREYLGHRHHLRFEIDAQATLELQCDQSVYDPYFAVSGCMLSGDECTPVRSIDVTVLENILDRIVPAHITNVIAFEETV